MLSAAHCDAMQHMLSATAQVPELLPTAVTEVLTNVGIEIASTGNEEVAAAAAASVGGSSGSGGSMDSPPAEAGVTPERLSEFWQQELDAWSMLLDGSSLDNHMEVLQGAHPGCLAVLSACCLHLTEAAALRGRCCSLCTCRTSVATCKLLLKKAAPEETIAATVMTARQGSPSRQLLPRRGWQVISRGRVTELALLLFTECMWPCKFL